MIYVITRAATTIGRLTTAERGRKTDRMSIMNWLSLKKRHDNLPETETLASDSDEWNTQHPAESMLEDFLPSAMWHPFTDWPAEPDMVGAASGVEASWVISHTTNCPLGGSLDRAA